MKDWNSVKMKKVELKVGLNKLQLPNSTRILSVGWERYTLYAYCWMPNDEETDRHSILVLLNGEEIPKGILPENFVGTAEPINPHTPRVHVFDEVL